MSEPSAPEQSPVPLGLRWGIKRSFIDYVQRMRDGQGALGDGALPVGPHEILFPPQSVAWGSDDDGRPTTTWTFRGDVRFSGHFGMLFLRVAAPVLTLAQDGTAELTVADPSGAEDGDRLRLVTLRLEQQSAAEGLEIWAGTDVRLTEAAVPAFNQVYPAGEEFEPLTIVLPAIPRTD